MIGSEVITTNGAGGFMMSELVVAGQEAMTQDSADRPWCHIEALTPRQDVEDLDSALAAFAEKLSRVTECGCVASIPDNPLGKAHFQAIEVIQELGLSVRPGRLLIHINTFHTRSDLDAMLADAASLGVSNLMIITGDGSERLAKLDVRDIASTGSSVTSVDLLKYIQREYPDKFRCGVAFNQYEPQDHELDKMKRKVDAGAQFIITQPVVGFDTRIGSLQQFKLPVIVAAWMSKRIDLLSECVGYETARAGYDPIANLRALRRDYSEHGLYLALFRFKDHFPLLKEMWN